MPQQDTTDVREKIISIIRRNGPSLPATIAREIGLSILFTSAFLSELASEKRLKISNLKVGNSPLYFIEGQEPLLEKFSHHLKSKEKEAFSLLKQKGFLEDTKQEPAIRIALREMKDFAIPFKKDDKIFWKFFSSPKEEIQIKEPKPEPEKEPKEERLDIFDKPRRIIKEKLSPRKSSQKESKFFSRVKSFLSENSIELLDIEGFSKTKIILRVRKQGQDHLLIAYNKKRINEIDILNAAKSGSVEGLPYIILSFGEPLKRVSDLIDAINGLSSIGKIK